MKSIYILMILAVILLAGCSQAPPAQTPPAQQPPAQAAVKEFTMTANNFMFSPGVITVSKGDRVRIKVTAMDTPHGIAIPAFGIDKPLPVGEQVVIEFTADNAGEFPFRCNVPCGTGHMNMTGKIVVQ